MSTVAPFKPAERNDNSERQQRIDLAACFRLAARMGWHESVANHFSLAISSDGRQFLMNPRWKHFSRIKASDLLRLDAQDRKTMERADAPDLTAWCLHGRLHANLPQARCILHAHPPYATAIACLADPEIKPIDQNTARFYHRAAYDMKYGGMANSDEEGDRLAALMGNRRTMMMGNHGVLVIAPTVGQAFDQLYYLERACQTLAFAYGTGQPLKIMSDQVAEKTAREWEEDCGGMDEEHFQEMKRILDAEDASYAD
jgi:ribulose-5-phosphate 4-epimerase/fuculose-1-phosphate aldolase